MKSDLGMAAEEQRFSILFVITHLGRGGAERQMILLASGLQNRGHRVAIALLDDEGDLAQEARELNIDLIPVYQAKRRIRLPKVLRFIAAARRFDPDVVHPYLPRDNARVTLVKPFLKGAKLVWGIRSSNMDCSQYGRKASLMWPVVVRLSPKADLIIANSWSGAEHHIEQGFPKDRIVVIPNGIDTERFKPDPESGKEFRAQNGIPSNVPLIGVLGRFDPKKGQHLFPEILSLVRERHPDVWGVLVGQHTEQQKSTVLGIAQRFGLSERLKIIPASSEPWAVINALDVLVVPSLFGEGFPNVIGEAIACGTPVAAFDVGDAARILEGHSEVAVCGDVRQLARLASRQLPDGPLIELAPQKISLTKLIENSESHISVVLTQRHLE
jgi:glycosyltransferase involved in cell wall biosynthesis